ncbi:hypothetical protein SAMN02745181_2323 [Rubritalea squalenifaciens DSM 18772]|uniref:Uncharacterized protein n=2 Tax=Rubritalea TaxID=361050 RepID=A0A1M6L860_9BACT|nr:hypothetical protein [Rubritalea squalenifaciens]SHJ67382.1 hypothetical protein SAMN02745181_2323 [Rubritalea squalenifaciens DSM 18772]
MADKNVKPIDKLKSLISQLREMEHYSRSNIEKLSEFWLLLEEEVKHDEFTNEADALLTAQDNFEQHIVKLIDSLQMTVNRMEQEGLVEIPAA